MRYDISKPTAPKMPNLGRGTECIKILLSQVSRDMHEPLVPMLYPILGAHISGAEFQYPDLSWKELCGMMANLVADSGCNKGQLSNIVEAICRDFRQHDEAELKKLVEWQRQYKSKASNKEKPARPEVAFWFPPADVTNAAFIQNAMALEALGERTQYLNMPEVEMADKMCGGHKQVTQMLRNIYDRSGQGHSELLPTASRATRYCVPISRFPALPLPRASSTRTSCSTAPSAAWCSHTSLAQDATDAYRGRASIATSSIRSLTSTWCALTSAKAVTSYVR